MKEYRNSIPVKQLSAWLNFPRSSFYYQPHPGARGMKPSTTTLCKGELVMELKPRQSEISIDISHLQPGIYFLNAPERSTVKIVKL